MDSGATGEDAADQSAALRASRRVRLALWGIVVFGGALRLWGLWFGLPHAQARPDETTAIGHALGILRGDLNPHFFNWPSLHLYVLAAIYAAGEGVRDVIGAGATAPSFSYYALLGRAYVALAGTLTIPALFLLARRAFGTPAGIAAAAFLAVAPLHVRDSHFALTDVPMTLLVTLSLWQLVEAASRLEAERDPSSPAASADARRTMALAGIVGGFAASTKYSAAVVLAPAALLQLWMWWRAGRPAGIRTWLPGLAFVACFVGGFVAGTPFSVLDVETFRSHLAFEFGHLAAGHGPDLGRGWMRHLSFSFPAGLGWPVALAAAAGLVAAARRGGGARWLLVVFAAAYYLSIGRGYTVFARYVLPVVPVACAFAAVALEPLASAVARRVRGAPATVLVLLTALAAAPAFVTSAWLDALLSRTDTRVLAARWLSDTLPREATLYESGREYALLTVESPGLHRWYFRPDTGYFSRAAPDALPQWIVLHRSPLTEYTPVPASVETLVRERYRLVRTFEATVGDGDVADYDSQDAFFLPLRGLGRVVRPGPTVLVHTLR